METTKNIVRTRYAPSPTGDPHIGNIRTALYAYLLAKREHGQFILRIEDTDKTREIPGSIDRIQESLNWLGITYDEGPILQSTRLEKYQAVANRLLDEAHAYYCFCTAERLTEVREQQVKEGLPPMYDKHCRSIDPAEAKKRAETETHVIRLKVPSEGETTFTDYLRGNIAFKNSTVDDQVLLKSDGFPTYHLAVVVDDNDMGITHIIRGDEWIPSTPKHVLLYHYLGWPIPTIIHLPLIVGTDKKKLSKRTGDTSLLSYKEQGYNSIAITNFLVRLGFTPKDDRKLYTLAELVDEFSLNGLHVNPAIFDLDKLNWFNRLAKEQSGESETLEGAIADILKVHGIVSEPFTETQYTFIREAAKRVDTVRQVEDMLKYLWEAPHAETVKSLLESMNKAQTQQIITVVIDTLSGIEAWDETALGNALRDKAKSVEGIQSKVFYQAITASIAGSLASPPLFASLALLGKDAVLARLATAKQLIVT